VRIVLPFAQLPEDLLAVLGKLVEGKCRKGGLMLLNNNLHTVIERPSSFSDAQARAAELQRIIKRYRSKCGMRVMWRSPNQLTAETREKRTKDPILRYGDGVDLDALEVVPRLSEAMRLPLIDAFAVTSEAPEESTDGKHYGHWEVQHEVHILLSQLSCLRGSGWGA
jgi:hypothetical protein